MLLCQCKINVNMLEIRLKSKNRLRFACNVSYFTGVKCGTLLMLTVYSCVSCVRFVFVHYFLSSCYAVLALLMWKLYYVRVYSLISMITVSYTHLRAHETPEHLVCRL